LDRLSENFSTRANGTPARRIGADKIIRSTRIEKSKNRLPKEFSFSYQHLFHSLPYIPTSKRILTKGIYEAKGLMTLLDAQCGQ